MTGKAPLFRQEAIDAQQTKWLGDIILIRPISFLFLTYLAIALAGAIVILFICGSYTKRITLNGQLLPQAGLLKVFAPQPCIVLEKNITEGQAVNSGDVLYILSASQYINFGEVQSIISDQIKSRQQSLVAEINQTQHLQRVNREELAKKIKSLKNERAKLESELNIQHEHITLAERTVLRYQGLLAQAYISREQLQQKQEELLDQKARSKSKERDLIGVIREIDAQAAEIANLSGKDKNQLAPLERTLASLTQELTESEAKRRIYIVAPRAGTTTMIQAEVGQVVDAHKPLISIVPSGPILQAELLAPSRSVGFVRPGDRVMLRYQAYAYQKFGHYDGTVESVSKTALPNSELPPASGGSNSEPLYRITVKLAQQQVTTYGYRQQLQSGMLVDADVLSEKRRLYEWVLEPLYSLTGKL